MADSIKIMDNRGSVATRVIASNRTTALTSTLVVIAAILAAFASSVAVIYTRPTHVVGSTLVDANDRPVATTRAMTSIDNITVLPHLGKDFDYLAVETISVQLDDDRVVGFRTIGYDWLNETDMDLFLANGMTLHIHEGDFVLSKTEVDEAGTTVTAHRRQLFGRLIRAASRAYDARAAAHLAREVKSLKLNNNFFSFLL